MGGQAFGAFGPVQQPVNHSVNAIPGLDGIVQWRPAPGTACAAHDARSGRGANKDGQLGNGGTGGCRDAGARDRLSNVVHIAAGGLYPGYTMAVQADGTVWQWGGGNGRRSRLPA